MSGRPLTLGAARTLLELGHSVSRNDVRRAYRRLARQWHPDKCGNAPGSAQRLQQLAEARDVLVAFCDDYRIPFDDAAPADAEQAVLERFYRDWCWGDENAPHGLTPRKRR